MNPLELAVSGIRQLSPYQPGKPIEELQRELGLTRVIKLASNENPLGPSPKVVEALRTGLAAIHLYPDGGGYRLKAALSAALGILAGGITLGNGSNDVLDLIARTFLAPGRSSVFSEHAFAVYPLVTQAAGADGIAAPAHDGSRGPRYGHDLEALADRVEDCTRVVFIANPNNPTGTYLRSTDLHGFLANLPDHVIAVIDEAYSEYVGSDDFRSALGWIDEFPNLIVTRTFSKAYGLAGLRVGYGVSGPDIAGLLNRVRQPFNLNVLGLHAAEIALADDEYLRRSVALNRTGLEQLCAGFAALGLDFIPSVGNFVTVDLQRPAGPLYQALLREGVIVRPIANYGLPQHLRVTVGTAEENDCFLDALRRVTR